MSGASRGMSGLRACASGICVPYAVSREGLPISDAAMGGALPKKGAHAGSARIPGVSKL